MCAQPRQASPLNLVPHDARHDEVIMTDEFTERRVVVVIITTYSGGPRFDSQPEGCLSAVVFLSPSMQVLR